MSLRSWWSRLRTSLRRGDRLERDMDREIEFHLEMSARRNQNRGWSREAAERQARIAFGSTVAMREDARDVQRLRVAENVFQDLRFALRSLRRSPSFTLTAVLTLAAGVGASTAIFSVVDAALLRPPPIPRPGDFRYLGWVWSKGGEIPALTAFQFEFLRDNGRIFEATAAYSDVELPVGTAASTPVRGLRVTAGFLGTLGFATRLGRTFAPDELRPGGAPVVLLGDGIWRTRFGADSGIIGRPIRMGEESRTVIGVLPPEFRFPPAPERDGFLLPLIMQADPADEGHNTDVIARLRRGTTEAERGEEMRRLSEIFRGGYPALAAPGESFRLLSHQDVHAGGIRRTIWMFFGAVTLLLLIACANTATLMLVRASARRREIAVRASLGAGPRRILQQLLTEGLVLSLIATAAGVLLAVLALRGFLAIAPGALPPGMHPRMDARVLGYAAGLSVLTALAFGLAAAAPSLRLRLSSGLLAGSRGATRGGHRLREALVVLETASAVVLLAGGILLVTSFGRLMRVDPGFDADRVVAVRLGALPSGYDAARRDQLVDRLLERLRGLPGVEHAAAAPNLPLERGRNFPVDTRERPDLAIGAVELRFVSPDYLATLGIPLMAGRPFGNQDAAGTEPVAIVNETFARHFWGESAAVGRTIQVGHFRDRWTNPRLNRQTLVVGVAADIHEIGLDRPARPTVLLARAQSSDGTPVLLVRSAMPEVAGSVRRVLLDEESRLVPMIEPLRTVLSRSVAAPRFRTLLIGTFAMSALLVAAIGIYGVIASVVQQRTREIGIRLALGASRKAVAAGVAWRSLVSVGAGAGSGLIGFWALRRILTSMLYETSTSDPVLLALAVVVLILTAGVAAWLPTRRALRIDPTISLRSE